MYEELKYRVKECSINSLPNVQIPAVKYKSEIESEGKIKFIRENYPVLYSPCPVSTNKVSKQARTKSEAHSSNDRFILAYNCNAEWLMKICFPVQCIC